MGWESQQSLGHRREEEGRPGPGGVWHRNEALAFGALVGAARGPPPSRSQPLAQAASWFLGWGLEEGGGKSQGRHLQGHQLLLNPRPRADRVMGPVPPRRGTCPRGETDARPPLQELPGVGGTGALGHSGGHSQWPLRPRRKGQAAPPTDPARGACISSHVPGAGLGSALVPNSAQKARLRTRGRVRLGKGLGWCLSREVGGARCRGHHRGPAGAQPVARL